jgi:methylated-DNA-[protein]-cysteine S-methyltransferase
METQFYYQSPVGCLQLTVDEGALTALRVVDPTRSQSAPKQPADAQTEQVFRQLDEYFAGRRRIFDLPLALHGTPFQQKVWKQLQQIPYGTTISYAQLAQSIEHPKACRAVGSANGKNPVAIIVPCHRVINNDGKLGGYAYGLEMKRRLLDLEGVENRPTKVIGETRLPADAKQPLLQLHDRNPRSPELHMLVLKAEDARQGF